MSASNGLPTATNGTFAAAGDDVVVTLDDIERLANSSQKTGYFDYYNCGSGQEQTLRENMSAFMRLRLRPRVLRGVAQRSTEVTLLGDQRLSFPVGISPTAAHKAVHTDGEVATAKAARDAKTVMVLNTFSHTSIEDVRRAVPDGLFWFQTGIYKDRDFTRHLVQRAERAGFKAVLLTVDMAVPGCWKDKLGAASTLSSDPPKMANLLGTSMHHYTEGAGGGYSDMIDASVTWADVTWLKSISKLPVVAKGILTAEDAEEAIKHGVSAILVSNHGGRQLDGVPSSIEALPEVVRAVRGRVEVYMDGGVRRGTDIIKALALGARAVFVARPNIWGLAYNGQAGVSRMLEILREELDRALALMGCSSVDELRPEMVVHQEYYYDLLKRPQK
ncbi:hydroxyacid oxidase 1-like [Ixodes scapularis]|uniref:hydroxyacid oxidase 1-like n=1 Tax=Ixodes scapularis TaxID=6945 RepID=UPI001AD66D44|nr:hydroxyacid oxidase 1-like [Ixodes scapularis]